MKLVQIKVQQEDGEYLETYERPETRGECVDGPRPCPWVTCKWHLAHVESKNGLRIVRHDIENMSDSCVLDLADSGPHDLDAIARSCGTTRQAVSLAANEAIAKAQRFLDVPPEKRRLEDYAPVARIEGLSARQKEEILDLIEEGLDAQAIHDVMRRDNHIAPTTQQIGTFLHHQKKGSPQ